ncbi:MAG: bifunctional 2-polyprenyl-6-hydroxyphenol methylase/3-demethylubiquinol 3-O-methyltransferase UbiG [Rhodoferax sp.]|nr:bifunctional 2-polyprenyl-6-hydroxyphenol methylase/3-demethylubiquinol 3-O-methyltransferase UbiG [Rhodoferax sp.]
MTAIAAEIERFNRLSATWWDSRGPMRPLHVVNALRLDFIVEQIASHLGHDRANALGGLSGLSGLRILDVGCGGGLMSEALARYGANVVGVDASPGNVAAARLHAQSQNFTVDYRLGEPAEVLSPHERFDVVLALEVVEHVSDVPTFLAAAVDRLAPGGMLFISTIDRTFKSFAVAIVGAEYLLRVLPRGTHQWAMFVRPEELRSALAPSKLHMNNLRGMRYLPVVHKASWCKDTKVNYIATFSRTPHDNYEH